MGLDPAGGDLAKAGKTDPDRRVRIIDADAHILEPPGIWTERLPARYADVAPRVERNPTTGHLHWRIGPHWLWSVGELAQAGWSEFPPSSPWEYEDCDPGAFDPAARLERLDEYGIDVQILYPNIVGFYAARIIELGSELSALCIRAYNDFLIDWCAADSSRLVPIAMLPFWDLDAALAEMRRCADLGFKGVLFANRFERINLPSFVSPVWDPIYATAQDLELPINFHIGFADAEDKLSAENLARRRADVGEARRAAVVRTGKLLMSQADLIGELLVSGLCERFGRLKLVSVETGFGHLPFYLEALDWQWKAWGNTSLPLLPSEYFRRQCFATFWFDRVSLGLLEHYPDNFMWSTDYPHPISLSPGPCSATDLLPSEWIDESFARVDPAVRAKALSGNAAALYGLSPVV